MITVHNGETELSIQLPSSHPLTAPVHPPERVTGPPELHHSKGRYPAQAVEATPDEEDDVDEQYAVFTAFGMFWRRESVEWSRNPKLLGMQQIGATPVDFNNQRGIYLLYDGREVIYVGRVTDRALGLRLYEHTVDRLATR